MSRKCKCKICKAELTTDIAFKVVINDKNNYYCSEKEYGEMIAKREDRANLLSNICIMLGYEEGMVIPSVMLKKIKVLSEFYPYKVIQQTFESNSDTINYWWNLEGKFSNEYGKVSYIMRIIENTINDEYKTWKFKERVKVKEEINKTKSNVLDIDIEPKRKKKDITSFLD